MRSGDHSAAILSVGSAVPQGRYTQSFLIEHFSITDAKTARFFEHPHIQTRHLILPPKSSATGKCMEESTGRLLEKHLGSALAMGSEAGRKALLAAGTREDEIDYLCCVTSTGYLVPGLSAWMIRDHGFRRDCQRADIVGMGCNAGLNGLNAVAAWCVANPKKKALLVCVEVCSAMYTVDDTERTAIVNSLFGDGAAACVVEGDPDGTRGKSPFSLLGFESHIMPDYIGALRFDWDDQKHRYNFFVGKGTPAILAENIHLPLGRLLKRFSLQKSDIKHWVAHSGGAAILDGIQKVLELDPTSLRHTRSVLRDYGNVSSGSFLFSLEKLVEEGKVQPGDHVIFMTMGPGLTIEMALARFSP